MMVLFTAVKHDKKNYFPNFHIILFLNIEPKPIVFKNSNKLLFRKQYVEYSTQKDEHFTHRKCLNHFT